MRLPAQRPVAPSTAAASAALALGALIWAGATFKFGLAGLALPLPLLAGIALLRWPGTTLILAVAAAVLAEQADWGLATWTGHLYDDLAKGFMPLDAILVLAVLGTLMQIAQDHRTLLVPPLPLTLALTLVLLGLAGGAYVGRAGGVGLTDAILFAHVFLYLVIVPLVAVNLRIGERDVLRVLNVVVVLAIAKALLGLLIVALGRGSPIDGSVLTYYAPTANWIMTVAMLGILAAMIGGVRVPWWMVLGALLMLAALVLSYRRSFWIGDALAIAMVVLLGLSSLGRLLLFPSALLVGVAIWALGGVALQSDSPLGERLSSLNSSKINAKPDDRYRIDERANVLHNITEHPIAGLGIGIPWQATKQPLPIEAEPTHQYVHFAALYWWLRLGLLGLMAYAALIAAGIMMSYRVWRAPGLAPPLRAFGLGSLASMIGLVVIETTTTFTGADVRFTLALAGQLALLAVCVRQAARADSIAVV
jgi:O-antigen ligase